MFTIIFSLLVCFGNAIQLFASSNGLVVNARIDPVVTPNTCSGHVHSIFGSLGIGSTVSSTHLTSSQTTSNIKINKSLYWAPSMYIKKGNQFHIVPSWARNYYFSREGTNPFPFGIRMVVGSPLRMAPWDLRNPVVHDDVRWTKRTENRKTTDSIHNGDWSYLKVAGVPEELEMKVNAPECVKLVNNKPVLDSDDHRSHLAYFDGKCPSSHPYLIPSISLEIRYTLSKLYDTLGRDVVNNMSNWYLANGDRSGASGHIDFISGWPEGVFRSIIADCDDGQDLNGRTCPVSKFFQNTQGERDSTASNMVTSASLLRPMPLEVVSPVAALLTSSSPCRFGLASANAGEVTTEQTGDTENVENIRNVDNVQIENPVSPNLVPGWAIGMLVLMSMSIVVLTVLLVRNLMTVLGV